MTQSTSPPAAAQAALGLLNNNNNIPKVDVNKDIVHKNKNSINHQNSINTNNVNILQVNTNTVNVNDYNKNKNNNNRDNNNNNNSNKNTIKNRSLNEPEKNEDYLKRTFIKNLKKVQKLGCNSYRKPPKKVSNNIKTQQIIKTVDDLMKEETVRRMKDRPSWNQLSRLVCAAAVTIESVANHSSEDKQSRSKLWFKPAYGELDKLRKIIGKVSAELGRRKGNTTEVAPTPKQINNIRLLEKRYRCKTFIEIESLVEKLKISFNY